MTEEQLAAAKKLGAHRRFGDTVVRPEMRLLTEREDGTFRSNVVPEMFTVPSDGLLWFPSLDDEKTVSLLVELARDLGALDPSYFPGTTMLCSILVERLDALERLELERNLTPGPSRHEEVVAQLRALMREHPDAAIEAVDTAKVARGWENLGENEVRLPLGRAGGIGSAGHTAFAGPLGPHGPYRKGEWLFGRPDGWAPAPDRAAAKEASDAAWSAKGWVLSKTDTSKPPIEAQPPAPSSPWNSPSVEPPEGVCVLVSGGKTEEDRWFSVARRERLRAFVGDESVPTGPWTLTWYVPIEGVRIAEESVRCWMSIPSLSTFSP